MEILTYEQFQKAVAKDITALMENIRTPIKNALKEVSENMVENMLSGIHPGETLIAIAAHQHVLRALEVVEKTLLKGLETDEKTITQPDQPTS